MIASGFMTVLPLLIKGAIFIIDRFSNNEKLKKSAMEFLSVCNKEMGIRLHKKYEDQIALLEDQLRRENELQK